MISFFNKIWKLRDVDQLLVEEYQRLYNVSNLVASILVSREIVDVENFLNPKLKNLIPEPFCIDGMEDAVESVYKSICDGKRILLWGDYDVDGVSSVSLLVKFFQDINFTNFDYYIPNRFLDGYGLAGYKSKNFNDVDVIIAVDCGTNDIEKANEIKESNKTLIILDHHNIGTAIPTSDALVNPHKHLNLQDLCATGVVFLFLIALNRKFKKILGNNYHQPDILGYSEIVAIATICDVVPLTIINRALVSYGLKSIKLLKKNIGLQKLIKASNITDLNTNAIGYYIGPKINASGRVDNARICVDLLTSSDIEVLDSICYVLDECNQKRKDSEKELLEESIAQAEIQKNNNAIIVYGDNWDIGIIGIIASRLVSRYNKPAIVISFDGSIGKASGRSDNFIDIGKALDFCKEYIIAGGGHKKAIGFSIYKEMLVSFKQNLEKYINNLDIKGKNIAYFDYELSISGANISICDDLEKLEPFGEKNSYPLFMISNVRFKNIRLFGVSHCSGFLTDESGGILRFTIFNFTNFIEDIQLLKQAYIFNVIGYLEKDNFYGGVCFRIIDVIKSI